MLPSSSPASLYALSVHGVVRVFDRHFRGDSATTAADVLTDNIRFDVYWELLHQQRTDVLAEELADLDIFMALLNVGNKRSQLQLMFQAAVGVGDDSAEAPTTTQPLHKTLARDLCLRIRLSPTNANNNHSNGLKAFGQWQNFVTFLTESGWFSEAESVLRAMLDKIRELKISMIEPAAIEVRERECQMKLLAVLSANCQFVEAEPVYMQLAACVADLGNSPSPSSASTSSFSSAASDQPLSRRFPHLSALYSEFSAYCFARSQYNDAYTWSLEAVKLLSKDLPPKVIIDVLRQSSKACVVRRQFAKAEILIQEAVIQARNIYGEAHAKYADCLVDYGFYLLNVDCVARSLQAYQSALEVRSKCFGTNNLNVAIAHEDLAYATYVYEYNSGRFDRAKLHAEKALEIMARLLPSSHLLLASSQRVLALILEEIAIDQQQPDKEESRALLSRSEKLHLAALNLAIGAFGEMNVQTAKHYGNLGRLYQTMENFNEAEANHLKAIRIKEELLGKDDYEVALSIGHLASLYNYDLDQFENAEALYLRSINIGVKLFGPGYSGLEYDYRGLIRVYQETKDWAKFVQYQIKLRDWKELRDQRNDESLKDLKLVSTGRPTPITHIITAVTSGGAAETVAGGKTVATDEEDGGGSIDSEEDIKMQLGT